MTELETDRREEGHPAAANLPIDLPALLSEAEEKLALLSASPETLNGKDQRELLDEVRQSLRRARRQAEEQLSGAPEAGSSRDILRALMEVIPEGVNIASAPDVSIQMISKYGLEQSGLPPEVRPGGPLEANSTPWQAFKADGETPVPPEERPLSRAIKRGETIRDEEMVARMNDGRELHLLCNAGPIHDGQGRITGGLLAWQNITLQRQAERELKAAYDRIHDILENMTDIFYAVDAGWRIVHLNRRAAAVLNRPQEDLLGRELLEAFPLAEGTEAHRMHLRAMRERVPVHLETYSPDLDAWVEAHIYPAPDGGLSVFFRDIGERKQAEDALRASEARFRILADATPVMISVTNADGENQFVNHAYTEFFGLAAEEVQSSRWQELIHPDDRAGITEAFLENLRKRQAYWMEVRVRRSDGEWRWIESHGLPYFSETGEFLGMAGSSIDVTERKQAEDALRESLARFRVLANATPVMIWVMDAEGETRFVNRTYAEFFGVGYEQVRSGGWQPLLHPDDLPGYKEAFLESLRERKPFRAVARARRSDGEWRWIESRGRPYYSDTDEFLGIGGSSLDVTEPKQAEQALKESESRYRTLADATPVIIWISDTDGNNRFVNRAYTEFFGVTLEQALGDRWRALVHPEDDEQHTRLYFECLRERKPFRMRVRVRRGDGEWRWIDSYGQPYFSETGEFLGMAGSSLDVTERTQAENELRASEERFRSVLEHSLDVAYRRDLRADCYDYMSPAVEQVLGFTPIEMNAMSIEEVQAHTHPDDRESVNARLAEAMQTGRSKLEYRFLRKDGQYRWVADYVTVVEDEDGQPRYLAGILRDIHDIKQIETELRALNRELEARVAERTAEVVEMEHRVIDSIESERTQLARDIHDGPMQDIYALAFRLAAIQRDQEAASIRDPLKATQEELLLVNGRLRRISQELLPPTLSNFGLDEAIRAHVAGIHEANPELKVHLDLRGLEGPLPDRASLTLYRIYQTLIANVLRHAEAGQAIVRLYEADGNCTLEVWDDGVGFEPPENWIELARQGHMGLPGAQERARSIGGRLEVRSKPGDGALLRVEVPRAAL